MTYVTDLVEALAKLQETKDELIDMGYESLQSPNVSNNLEESSSIPEENNNIEKGQNLEEQNMDYESVGAMPAGEVGSVTMPGPIASTFKKKLKKYSNKTHLSKVFKNNLIKKWNKE